MSDFIKKERKKKQIQATSQVHRKCTIEKQNESTESAHI